MTCKRLCYTLHNIGKPLSNYQEIVATIVTGKTSLFLESMANVVRENITEYLKTWLEHKVFKQPVKIAAGKKTIKHRIRKIIALTTFYPKTEKNIKMLYIACTVILLHKSKDALEHINLKFKNIISSDQYHCGS